MARDERPLDEIHERALLLDRLRYRALSEVRAIGCTCEPAMELTAAEIGPQRLPMWTTEHDDELCELALQIRRERRRRRGLVPPV